MSEFFIPELSEQTSSIKAAIFDFDGTVSMLRCGWEAVMEKIMYDILKGCGMKKDDLISYIRDYIDDSTGIQTVFQMEWLCEQVKTLCHKEPLSAWDYKDIYNEELLKTVNGRIHDLETGKKDSAGFLVKGSREFLDLLSSSGIDIYIASGTDEKDVRHEADILHISELVKEVRGAPERRKDCSKEAVIRGILKSGKAKGSELMVVGDGKVEIALGKEAGAVTVGIASRELRPGKGMNPKKAEKLMHAGAGYIAEDFSPIIALWKGEYLK